MQDNNLEKLLESVKFRIKSIFNFKNLTFIGVLFKIILLVIFGLFFCVVELLGLFFSLLSNLYFVGIVLNFTVCFVCDLLASGLFYLIMLPNSISIKENAEMLSGEKLVRKVQLTESEYQDVYDAITWCNNYVDIHTENILNKYKDDLFFNSLSGINGQSLLNILIKIKNKTNDEAFILKLDFAIAILKKKIYKNKNEWGNSFIFRLQQQ